MQIDILNKNKVLNRMENEKNERYKKAKEEKRGVC